MAEKHPPFPVFPMDEGPSFPFAPDADVEYQGVGWLEEQPGPRPVVKKSGSVQAKSRSDEEKPKGLLGNETKGAYSGRKIFRGVF